MIALTLALSLAGSVPASTAPIASLQHTMAVESVMQDDLPPASASTIRVRLRCTAFGDGHVGACAVLEETRPGKGFGRAAVALMEMSEVEPDRHDNHPVDVTFEHTIDFTP